MGLINYTQIEDNTPASANGLNSRFGQIIDQINGNLDSSNLKDQAVTRAKIATGAVTPDKLDTSLTIDDNGWTVTNLGGIKTYTRQLTVNNLTINGQGTRATLGTFQPPVGRTSNNVAIVATWFGGYGGHLVVAGEPRDNDATIYISGGNIWPAPLTFNGKVNIQATEIN